MATGIMVSVKSNHPRFYLVSILLFLFGGIILAILGFTGVAGGTGGGVLGIALYAAGVVLLLEFFATRRSAAFAVPQAKEGVAAGHSCAEVDRNLSGLSPGPRGLIR
jgi:hypothetical protein